MLLDMDVEYWEEREGRGQNNSTESPSYLEVVGRG